MSKVTPFRRAAALPGQLKPGTTAVRSSRLDFMLAMTRRGLKPCPTCSDAENDVYHPNNLCSRGVRRTIITDDNLRQG